MEWKGKNIALTGATGFIGAWLANSLLDEGANITLLMRKNSPRGLIRFKGRENSIKVLYGDVRDPDAMKGLVNGQDALFHLAAITQVLYSKTHPVDTFNIDANGTLNILEALRKSARPPFLLFVSTDKVYGEPKYVPIDEDCPVSSKSPYDAAKLAADRLVNSYNISYGLKSSIVRMSNIIGGGDANILRAVPDFILNVLSNKAPVIRGNGKHIRDYLYVKDAVAGIKLVAEKQNKSNGEVFNLGTGKPTSVIQLANMVIAIADRPKKIKPILLKGDTLGEIDKQYISSGKIRRVLGWKPAYTLKEALKETLEWYDANPEWISVVERVNKYYSV